MKTILQLSLAIFCSALAAVAQIPNGDFESWAENEPTGYTTTNLLLSIISNPPNVTKVPESHSGSSAVKLQVVETNFLGAKDTLGAFISSFKENTEKFAVGFRPSGVTGFYKFTSPKNDKGGLIMIFTKWDKAKNKSDQIGFCAFEFNKDNISATYKQFTAVYFSDVITVPDSASIIISCGDDDLPIPGTALIIDDLSLTGGAVSTEKAISTEKLSLGPNPANEFVKISNIAPNAHQILVKEMNGKLTEKIVIAQSDYLISTSAYQSGMYLVEVRGVDNQLLQVSKFIVQQ